MSAPLDFFGYRGSALRADGVSIEKLAREHGTPLYVYSSEALLTPLRELQKGLRGLDHLICFAVKSCSNLAILKLLAKNGAGMDLVSGGELFRARKAGVRPGKIVFSGVGKTPEEMADALEAGIFSFNVESAAELQTLNDVATSLSKKARVALRFNPDVNAKTHPYISTGLKKNKFGMNRAEVLRVAAHLAELPAISLEGLSIHIGSQLTSLSPLSEAFDRLKDLIDELRSHYGVRLRFADLGGGLAITYKNERPPSIAQYCRLIQKKFGTAGLKILIEPGRTISGNAGILVTEVLYRKSGAEKDFLVVDAAMNDLIRPALYQSHHEIVPVKENAAKAGSRSRAKVPTDVVGPVCETADFLAQDRPLSPAIRSGDLLAVLSAGAYGFVMSGNYNSRPRPAEVLITNGKPKVIRERESLRDLIRGERS